MKALYLAMLFLLLPTIAHAAVTGVTGTVVDGQSITVLGTSFGPNGPNVRLWENFDGGTLGNQLATNLAPIGEWSGIFSPQYTSYSNANVISGPLAARFDITTYNSATENHPVIYFQNDTAFDSFFIAYWSMLPAGNTFPGDGYGGANWKEVWVAKDDSVNDADLCVMGNGWTWYHWFGNDPYHDTYDSPSWTFTKVAGRWDRYAWWTKGSTSNDGATSISITNTNGTTTAWEKTGVQTLNTGDSGKRRQVYLNGYVRTTPNSYPTFDDVYLAVGDYAQARVEIGDASTYAACTKLSVCTTPLGTAGWSDTSITCTVRGGNLTAGNAWVYVINADGTRSAGYPVTYGSGGGGDTTPPTITAFTMPSTATSLTVNVSSFTATDAVGVTGYCITTTNSSAGCSWSGSAPATATASGAGSVTWYAWARDAALNVSNASTQSTTITLPVQSIRCGGRFSVHN
jgi:hypothetical protein